jgi:hypothetical protein
MTTATTTELCNVALGHIGQARIADIGERSPAAEHCRRMFDHVRRLCLRDHDWNFAVGRESLTALSTPPPFGFSAAYQLPADCLRVLAINGQPAGVRGTQWEVEGRTVLINADVAHLRYIRDADDVTQWDSIFQSYFSYRLAAAVAPSFRIDPQAGLQLEQMAAAVRASAQEADNVETAPRVTRLDQSEIIQERGSRWPSGTAGTGTGNAGGSSIGWSRIAVTGQPTVAATVAGDTFTLVAGTNVTITTDATAKTVTISATGGGGGGASETNLALTRSANAVTITNDNGDGVEIPQANATHAGVMTANQHNKLDGIQDGAEVNVNADWNAVSGDALILNKPTISGTNTGNVSLATSVSAVLTLSGQQLQAITDPGADRLVFFDQSANAGAGAWGYLTAGAGLSISGTTITATFGPAAPGAIGGTTPSTAVFTQLDVRTEIDVQSTSGSAGPILSWNTPTTTVTDWERARMAWSSNVFTLSTERNGTGVAHPIEIAPGGVTAARFTTDGRTVMNGTTAASSLTRITMGTPSSALSSYASGLIDQSGIVASTDGSNCALFENTKASGSGQGAFASLYSSDGAAMASGDRLGGFLIGGSSSSSNLRNACIAEAYATQTWVDGSAYGSAWNFATTANGGTSRTGKMWINGDGNVGIGNAVFSVSVAPTARVQIRGAGTGTGVTLLVENSSGTARFTVRDDGAFAFAGGTVAVAETGWTTFTNITTDRTCDANATTVEELADILGTLIVALKNKGILAN